MDVKIFLKALKKAMGGLEINQTIDNSGFFYIGINKNDAFGSRGGFWNPTDFPAFEFTNNDEVYLIRIIDEQNKIVVESLKQQLMILNYGLNKNNFLELSTNEIEIKENYKMTVKNSILSSKVREALLEVGMISDIIYKGHPDDRDKIISSLIFWAGKRADAKKLIRAEQNGIKKKIDIPKDKFSITGQENLNRILYGPPGTGKTFHSINYAVAIVENSDPGKIAAENRANVKKRFDEYMAKGQIVFTTFHQSLSYEDFIEGIKPVEPISEEEELTYAVLDGIFKRLCTEATFSFIQNNSNIETEKVLDFSSEYDRFVDYINEKFSKGEVTELETRSGGNVFIESISSKNNIWVKHFDGSRNYTVSKKRLSKLSQAFPDLNEVTNINDQFRTEIGGSNSSAYWAVLNAIRNQPAEDKEVKSKQISSKEYSYDDKKEINESIRNDDFKIDNPKRYVLIIDEINRGNVSQIFGELISLIEEDKRIGEDESLKAILPYSKESFGVPNNVYIIGTMNTADRSVEALDTALRRRFTFIPKMPEEYKLIPTDDGIDLSKLLVTINSRLRILKDNDHTIGHAWLWNISSLEQLQFAFENKILPLLQEYFYNDFEKLGLVLGDAFFKPHKQINSNVFASFSGGNGLAGQYDQSWQYELKTGVEITLADFKTLEKQSVTDDEY
jgi:5-methylcytosine-specific restriction enzyme B